MAEPPKIRVKVPESVKAGAVVTLRALISHPMESGQRKDGGGNLIPRKIINSFTCSFNGQAVMSCDLAPAISANPYFEFNARVPESGTFQFTWVDDDGSIYSEKQSIEAT